MTNKIQTLSFRDLYQQLVYIEDKNTLNVMKMGYQVKTDGQETGLLAYGYIDEEKGICFNIFSIVKLEDDDIVAFNDEPMLQKINHRVRLEDLKDANAMALDLDPDIAIRYKDRAIEINKANMISKELMILRANDQIDAFRHHLHPDDFECFVFDPSINKIEAFWARGLEIKESHIVAKVLTPLSKEYGFGIGDRIEVSLYQYKDETRLIHLINQ